MRQQKEKITATIASEARTAEKNAEVRGAEAESGTERGSEESKSTGSGGGDDEGKLKAMEQELVKLKAELERSTKSLALKIEEQAVAEANGWISSKAKFSEVAAQRKEEAERKEGDAEFSRELTVTRAKLKSAEKELAKTETQLQKARVSWNETTSKEKEKLRAENLELRQAAMRAEELERADTRDTHHYQQAEMEAVEMNMRKVSENATDLMRNVQTQMGSNMKEMASLVIKFEESNAETERLTAIQTGMETRRQALQDRLEEQASETFMCRAETKEWEEKHKEVKGQHDLLVSQNAQIGEDKARLQKEKETLKEQAETLKIENTELPDATKHTAGSNERVKDEIEGKRIQIEQLQDDISQGSKGED